MRFPKEKSLKSGISKYVYEINELTRMNVKNKVALIIELNRPKYSNNVTTKNETNKTKNAKNKPFRS